MSDDHICSIFVWNILYLHQCWYVWQSAPWGDNTYLFQTASGDCSLKNEWWLGNY